MKLSSKPNPERVYNAIAEIIGEMEGVKITVVSVKEKQDIEPSEKQERGIECGR